MATLQKIRNKAVLLTVIIGLALFAFIIGDFLNSSSSLLRQSKEDIATIGDYSLNYKEYEARVQEMIDVYKIQTGQENIEDEMMAQLRETVFQSTVRENIIEQEATKLGVTVTSKEVFDMINGANVHPLVKQLPIFMNPQTRQFDRSVMMNFLQTIQQEDLSQYEAEAQTQIVKLKAYWLFWEHNLKYTKLEEKMNSFLTKAIQANTLDVETDYANRAEQVDFAYVVKPYSSLADSLFKISDSDIKKRYNRKKESFFQEPFRTADYVLVNVTASKEDFTDVETKINGMRDAFIASSEPAVFANSNSDETVYDCYVANNSFDESVKTFLASNEGIMEPTFKNGVYRMARVLGSKVAPDSVNARQIVLPLEGGERADSILTVLRAGGDFQAIATKINGGANSEMGWFRESDAAQMGETFLNACFGAAKNAYFTVKTKYDLRVMQVTDVTKPVAKTKLALISLKVTPSSITYSKSYNALNRILAENQDAKSFFEAASKAGYTVQEAPYLLKNAATMAGIPQMRQAVRFAFNNKVNSLSPILENNNNQFVVIGVKEVSDENYLPLSIVKPQLMKELIDERKGDHLISSIDIQKTKTLAQFSLAEGLRIDTAKLVDFSMNSVTGLGNEPALIAAATQAQLNSVTGPLKGKNGVYLFQVVAKKKSQEEFNVYRLKQGWNYNNMYRINYQGYNMLRKAYNVEDERIRFY